jgi:general secretion pathway protein M
MAGNYLNLLRDKLSAKLPARLTERLREKSGFDKLEPRERLVIYGGVAILVCFVFLQFVLTPYLTASKKLDRALENRKADIVELKLLQQEYRNLQDQAGGIRKQLETRPANFSLFSFLDNQASAAAVKDFISYMKPSTTENSGGDLLESLVEMKLQEIGLKQLVDFLQRIESPENVVSIKRISVQESGKQENSLDVIMQIVTFVDNGS